MLVWKTAQKFSWTLSFGLLFLLFSPSLTRATTLGDLPLGSVIQIMGTDTGMCVGARCDSQTDFVLPYKFVKMQARRTTTSGDTAVGTNGNCPSENTDGCAGYSYFMLMDNYCWWGSANCQIGHNYTTSGGNTYTAGEINSNYSGLNGICEDWNSATVTCETDLNGTGFSNNLSDPQSVNILQPMANLYNSLPDEIGGKAKSAAIASYNWDMIGVSHSPTGTPAVGWFTDNDNRTWPTTPSYDHNGVTYVFSGDVTNPIMNSKIGLLSYTEWQGGLYGRSYYPVMTGGKTEFKAPSINLRPLGRGMKLSLISFW